MKLLLCLLLPLSLVAQKFPVPFQNDGKFGYVDSQNEIVIPAIYLFANEFSSSGVATVHDGEQWILIDKAGNEILEPLPFDNGPDYFREGLARYIENDKIGFYDPAGNIAIPALYDFAFPFSEGLAIVCMGCNRKKMGEHSSISSGKWGFINKEGKLVIPLQYEAARPFTDGRAEVKKGGKWYLIDEKGYIMNVR